MQVKFPRLFSSVAIPVLVLGVLSCSTIRQPSAASSAQAATVAENDEDAPPAKPTRLFGSSDIQPTGNSALHYIDARLYELRDQDKNTLASLKQALQMDPDSSYLHSELARNLAEGNQFEQAGLEVETAMKLDPKNANLHLLRGKLYSVKQMSDQAIAEYEQCIQLKPDLEDCYTMMAREYALQKDTNKAVATIQRLLKVDPQSTSGLYYLGTLYSVEPEKAQAAIQAFKAILEDDPDDMKALASLAQLYLDRKKYPEALSVLLRIEHLAPHDIPIKLRIGLIYYEMKDYEAAVDRFTKALQL